MLCVTRGFLYLKKKLLFTFYNYKFLGSVVQNLNNKEESL